MSLVSQIENAITKELDRVSQIIESELIAECPERTGTAKASIHIEQTGQYERFVGGTNKNLYFADEGNGGAGKIITSTRPYDRLGRPPGKLKLADGSFRSMVHGYYYADRQGFVKRVADRHR